MAPRQGLTFGFTRFWMTFSFQKVISSHEGSLNKIAFNSKEPILIVGDSTGKVHSLKLSPNLRKKTKEAQKALGENDLKQFKQVEVTKMEKILSQVVQDSFDSD